MFLMMYKCDCCILSFTSANTDNDHCDDVLMYDDGDDPSMISHPCTMYHRSWSTDDWHTADDEPKSHHHCSGRPPPLLVPILHHLAHIYTMHPLFSQNIHVINIVGKHFAFSVFSQDLCSCIIYLNYAGFLFINTKAHIYFYNFAARFNIKNLNFNLITL